MPESAGPIAILIVDDHNLFRESLARLLDRESDFDVVGHVESIDEAFAILRKRRVDLVLLDFDLGQRDGIDFMYQAGQSGVQAKVLIVTAGIQLDEATALIRAGMSF